MGQVEDSVQERSDTSHGFEQASNPDSAETEPHFDNGTVGVLYFLYRFSSPTQQSERGPEQHYVRK